MMDREALIKAMQATADEPPTKVETDKWGTLYVRAATVAEVDAQQADTAVKDDKNKLARAACRVICDESGQRFFDADNEADVELMAKQPWPYLRKLLAAADGNKGDAGNG